MKMNVCSEWFMVYVSKNRRYVSKIFFHYFSFFIIPCIFPLKIWLLGMAFLSLVRVETRICRIFAIVILFNMAASFLEVLYLWFCGPSWYSITCLNTNSLLRSWKELKFIINAFIKYMPIVLLVNPHFENLLYKAV